MLARAIASARAQTFQDWELVVVQDIPDERTGLVLNHWASVESRLRRLSLPEQVSIAEASNFGLAHARGEYVAILDDDDVWCDAGKLATQVRFLDDHADYVACGGGYYVRDGNHSRQGILKPERDEQIRARALVANPIANSTAVFRRVVNGEPVRYDPKMRGFADWDFWLCVGRTGKLYNFSECFAEYSLWEGSGSFKNTRTNALTAIRIVWKHRYEYRGFWLAWSLACAYVLYSYLPLFVRRASFIALSNLKKRLLARSRCIETSRAQQTDEVALGSEQATLQRR